MVRLVFILGILFSSYGLAHGHHDHAQEDHELLSQYLEAAFVEVEREPEAIAVPSAITFRTQSGEVYSVRKSRLADALTKAYATAMADHAHHHPDHGPAPTPSQLKVYRDRVLTFLLAPINGFKEMVLELPQHLSYLAAQVGILPAGIVAAVWFPYSWATETLESMVMGPYHWACPFFQLLFWGPILYMVFDFNLVKDIVLYRNNEAGIFRRLGRVFANRVAEFQFRRSLFRSVTVELEKARSEIPAKNSIAETFLESSLWYRLLEHRGNAFLETAATADSLTETVEMTESLYLLRNLLKKQLELAHETGKLSYWNLVKAQYFLGQIDSGIGIFHRSLWILAGDSQKTSAPNQKWVEESVVGITQALKALFQFSAGYLDLSQTTELINRSLERVTDYRNGMATPCEFPFILDSAYNAQISDGHGK